MKDGAKKLFLQFFVCWLAAWRSPFRGAPWQLKPFCCYNTLPATAHWLKYKFTFKTEHILTVEGYSHYICTQTLQLYTFTTENIFFLILKFRFKILSTDLFEQHCQSVSTFYLPVPFLSRTLHCSDVSCLVLGAHTFTPF